MPVERVEPDLVHSPGTPHQKDKDIKMEMQELGHEDRPRSHDEVQRHSSDSSKKTRTMHKTLVEDETRYSLEDQKPSTAIKFSKYGTEGVGSTVSRRGRKRSPVALPPSSRRGRKRSSVAPTPPPPPRRSSPGWKNYIASLAHALSASPTIPKEEQEDTTGSQTIGGGDATVQQTQSSPQSPRKFSLKVNQSPPKDPKWTSPQTYSVPEQSSQQEWEDKFKQLVRFKESYGNCNVPLPWKDNGQLGRWALEQKQQYRLWRDRRPTTLTDKRIKRLKDIGVNLYSIKLTWQERFQQLLSYKKHHGNCNVPQGWKENPSLAIWVNEQRKTRVLLEKGQKSCMTQSRIDELDNVGFEWSRNKLLSWEERFEELKDYKRKHGHCNIPWSSEEDRRLYNWTVHQRANGRLLKEGKKSNITQERVEALDRLGFDWTISKKKGSKSTKEDSVII